MNTLRRVDKIFTPKTITEGIRAQVRRIIGVPELRRLDPFLMLDDFSVKLPGGFPDHPHRGFEIITYIQKGGMLHEDFRGHKGTLEAGDLQCMTVGKGIVHAEVPTSDKEESSGLQLWVNLEKDKIFSEPCYQNRKGESVPIIEKDGVQIKLLSGEAYDKKGPIIAQTPIFYMDITVPKDSFLSQSVPVDWNAMCYVYEGEGYYGADKEKGIENNAVVLKKDDGDFLEVYTKDKEVRFVLLAGKPLNQRIVQNGLFVLENKEDLKQTLEDWNMQKNGFEGGKTWKSSIKEQVYGRAKSQ